MRLEIHEDGAYVVDDRGKATYLDGAIVNANPDGSATIRFPARDVTVVTPLDPTRTYDMSDATRLIVAVVFGGITIAQIAAVRPGVAAVVQAFLTNHGLSAGTSA